MVEMKRICNICGREFDAFDRLSGLALRQHLGYGSTHDGSNVSLDLCCHCFDELLDTYLLPKCEISPLEEEDALSTEFRC